jgi:hypothetical protein
MSLASSLGLQCLQQAQSFFSGRLGHLIRLSLADRLQMANRLRGIACFEINPRDIHVSLKIVQFHRSLEPTESPA